MNIDPIEELRIKLDQARKEITLLKLDLDCWKRHPVFTVEQLQPLLTCLRCVEENCRIAPGEDTVAALAPKCIFSESAAKNGLQHAKSIGLVKEDKS